MADDTGADGRAGNRREQMLAAAAELIPQRGFANTRISDVAHRAGVSPALVIYYFGTKDQLLTEAVRYNERIFDELTQAKLAETTSFLERLETIVELSCAPSSHQGAWSIWLELWAQALRRPESAASRRALDDEWRALIERIIREAVASGEVGSEVDVEDFVVTFAALLDGLLIQVALEDPQVSGERAASIAMRFARIALGLEGHVDRKTSLTIEGVGRPK
jgi:AcrR family transcriptional regulator